MAATRAAMMALLGLWALGCNGGGANGGDGGAGSGGAGDGGAGSGGGAGGGGAGGACTDFVDCAGGSLVGTWRIDQHCVPATTHLQAGDCSGEFFDLTQIVSYLTWAFRADLSTTVTIIASGPATVRAPEACLVSGGAPIACADAGPMYSSRIAIVGAKAGTAACQSAGGICTCAISFVEDPALVEGTYSVAGTALSYEFGTGTIITVDYCATATVLTTRGRPNVGPGSIKRYDRQ